MESVKLPNVRAFRVGGSVAVVLPPIWRLNTGVNAGDVLEVQMTQDGSLILRKQHGGG